jgi:hypothetical protein
MQNLKDSSLDSSFIASAISRFPNLNVIILLGPFGLPSDKLESLREKGSPSDRCQSRKRRTDNTDRIRSLQSLFFAMAAANTKSEKLIVQRLSWRFWDQHASLYYPVLTHLKHITLLMDEDISADIWSAEHGRRVSALRNLPRESHALVFFGNTKL